MTRRAHVWFAAAFLVSSPALADTGDPVASFPSSFPSPDGLAWDGAFLWATDCSYSRIDKVDPATGAVVGSIDVAGVSSDELAWDGTAMWVSDHTKTEMPSMPAPPPRIYRVDTATAAVLSFFDAPSDNKYPMGLAWDGKSVWNVDPWDGAIYELDPATGAIKRSLPSPAPGACGLTWDGACLWLTDAQTDGLVYHIDATSGEVIRKFPGPGGKGHQTTGIAWDGKNLWIHDEAKGRAKIHKVVVEDITESGRCAGAFQAAKDAGADALDAGSDGDGVVPPEATDSDAAPEAAGAADAAVGEEAGTGSQQSPGTPPAPVTETSGGCSVSVPSRAGGARTPLGGAVALLVLGVGIALARHRAHGSPGHRKLPTDEHDAAPSRRARRSR
jgi:glutamine cyclotransferase